MCPKSVKRTPAHALFTFYSDLEDARLLWEMLKVEIRAATIAYSKNKVKATTNRELEITRQLEILDRNICDNFNSPDIARILKEYEDLKTELQSIYEEKGRAAIFISKCRWVEKGERMVDIDTMSKALKLAWISRLLIPGNQSWKTVPDYYLRKFGGLNFVLRCNYDAKYIKSIPLFYRKILVYFNELKALYNFDQVQDIILFSNKEILVDSRTIFIREWFKKGILSIQDLLDNRSPNVLPRIYEQILLQN